MRALSLILALALTACATTGYQEPVPVTGDGLDHCDKGDCPEKAPR